MKKLLLATVALSLLPTAHALDSQRALKTFQSDLANIKQKLKAKKLSVNQAAMLLQALEVRQNNVLIAQNQEIIKRLAHESK